MDTFLESTNESHFILFRSIGDLRGGIGADFTHAVPHVPTRPPTQVHASFPILNAGRHT